MIQKSPIKAIKIIDIVNSVFKWCYLKRSTDCILYVKVPIPNNNTHLIPSHFHIAQLFQALKQSITPPAKNSRPYTSTLIHTSSKPTIPSLYRSLKKPHESIHLSPFTLPFYYNAQQTRNSPNYLLLLLSPTLPRRGNERRRAHRQPRH